MTCINTGNAWVRVRNGARQRAPDWLSLHFSLLAVYLGGEISSLKLGLGLFSFSRRWLLHASIDSRIDLLRNFEFDRTGGWSEREVWPIDRHGIARSLLTMVDLLDPLFQSWLCLDNTNQRCCWRGTWSPLSFWRGQVHGASARIDVCGRGKHALKLQLQWPVSWRHLKDSFPRSCKLGLRTPTEAGPTFQIVVDDIEVEMWLGWLENHEMGCAARLHCGGRRACSLRAAELDPARKVSYVEGSPVLTCLQVNVCLGILSARTCNADHGDILWKKGHVGICMGLTTGKAWAIDWRGSVGTWKVTPHVVGCTSDVDELFRFYGPVLHWRTWDCAAFPPHAIHSKAAPSLGAAMIHTHARAHTWTPHTRTCTLFSVRIAVNNRWNVSAAFFLIFVCTLLTSVACATCQSSIWHILFIVAFRHVSAHARTHTHTHTHTHIIHSNHTHAYKTITSAHAS